MTRLGTATTAELSVQAQESHKVKKRRCSNLLARIRWRQAAHGIAETALDRADNALVHLGKAQQSQLWPGLSLMPMADCLNRHVAPVKG